MKTITIPDKIWSELHRFKYTLCARSLGEVIQALIKISTTPELASELNKKGGKK